MRTFLLSLVLLSCSIFSVKAQSNKQLLKEDYEISSRSLNQLGDVLSFKTKFHYGFIITHEGDSLFGDVAFKGAKEDTVQIYYRPFRTGKKKSKKQKFKVKDLAAFGMLLNDAELVQLEKDKKEAEKEYYNSLPYTREEFEKKYAEILTLRESSLIKAFEKDSASTAVEQEKARAYNLIVHVKTFQALGGSGAEALETDEDRRIFEKYNGNNPVKSMDDLFALQMKILDLMFEREEDRMALELFKKVRASHDPQLIEWFFTMTDVAKNKNRTHPPVYGAVSDMVLNPMKEGRDQRRKEFIEMIQAKGGGSKFQAKKKEWQQEFYEAFVTDFEAKKTEKTILKGKY